jgi:hypothetical protein
VSTEYDRLLTDLDKNIQAIRTAALQLRRDAEGIQAVERNVDRILASTRMLEINVSDVLRDPATMASYDE